MKERRDGRGAAWRWSTNQSQPEVPETTKVSFTWWVLVPKLLPSLDFLDNLLTSQYLTRAFTPVGTCGNKTALHNFQWLRTKLKKIIQAIPFYRCAKYKLHFKVEKSPCLFLCPLSWAVIPHCRVMMVSSSATSCATRAFLMGDVWVDKEKNLSTERCKCRCISDLFPHRNVTYSDSDI